MTKYLPIVLLGLASCVTELPYAYTKYKPERYYAVSNTWAYRDVSGDPVGAVRAGDRFVVVGTYQEWLVLKTQHTLYLAPPTAFKVGNGPFVAGSPLYIYPAGYRGIGPPVPTRNIYIGPRGGVYYFNGNGNKTYIGY